MTRIRWWNVLNLKIMSLAKKGPKKTIFFMQNHISFLWLPKCNLDWFCERMCVRVRAFMRGEICLFLCRGSSQYLTELFQTLSLLEILHVSSVYLGTRSHDVVFGPCLGCTAWTLSLFKDTREVTLNSLLCLIVGFLLWHVHSWRQPSVRQL